jgi:hypothetical protein
MQDLPKRLLSLFQDIEQAPAFFHPGIAWGLSSILGVI